MGRGTKMVKNHWARWCSSLSARH